ncbi:MAG: GntR family transcriptional regulator [Anaerolineales bacterium]|nr:GntR family transcriptional regulator [Anaerolineales bacterium]
MSPYPELDRTGPAPIYLQIEAWIREQIATGAWPARFKLKAEVDLAKELDVSRGTVRKAISELMAEGLLTQTHGRGTFVTPQVVEQPLADRFVTFSEDLISKGIPFETRVLEQAGFAARGRVAALLEIPPGERGFFLRRVRLVSGEPLILLNNYVVYRRCPGVEEADFTTERLFQVLEEQYALETGAWAPHLSGAVRRRRRGAVARNGSRRSYDARRAARLS